eukprot:scaffold3273_cov148-Cylindrotheca_fusiformis.AAC.11
MDVRKLSPWEAVGSLHLATSASTCLQSYVPRAIVPIPFSLVCVILKDYLASHQLLDSRTDRFGSAGTLELANELSAE